MAFNLFITYDLSRPEQNGDAIREAIARLGPSWQFQDTVFWVNTPLTPHKVYSTVREAMVDDDRLCVINANQGVVSNWDRPPADEINPIWSPP